MGSALTEIRKVGIDAGGTLVKIAYYHQNEINFIKFSSYRLNEAVEWIRDNSPNADICMTGGKSAQLQTLLNRETKTIVEFEATCEGVKHLSEKQSINLKSFVLTNVGTGTSIHYVDELGNMRVGGSGVGGGTIMGLSSLITGIDDYERIIEMSQKGDRKLDLTVSDIYEGSIPPISGELTASNFGKVKNAKSWEKEDILASIIGLVGETITTVSIQAAVQHNTSSILYIGSSFVGNDYLKEIVKKYSVLRGADAYFPENGDYSGAIGALLSIS